MPRAALRDASWHRSSSTGSERRVYHVVREDGHQESACGIPVVEVDGSGMQNMTIPAEEVAPTMRCMRPGCRPRWPAFSGIE